MRTGIATARLRLGAFTSADAAELHEIFADPLTHTIGSGPFTSPSQTERWICNRMETEREHGLCWYALRDRQTDRMIGNCGMFKGRMTCAEPEIGYMISKRYQGQGFATEAATAVMLECQATGVKRVWASIRPHNTASRRIVERLGFHLARTDHDERGDLLFYVIDHQQHPAADGLVPGGVVGFAPSGPNP